MMASIKTEQSIVDRNIFFYCFFLLGPIFHSVIILPFFRTSFFFINRPMKPTNNRFPRFFLFLSFAIFDKKKPTQEQSIVFTSWPTKAELR